MEPQLENSVINDMPFDLANEQRLIQAQLITNNELDLGIVVKQHSRV